MIVFLNVTNYITLWPVNSDFLIYSLPSAAKKPKKKKELSENYKKRGIENPQQYNESCTNIKS